MNDKEMIRRFTEDLNKMQNQQPIEMDGLLTSYAQELQVANQLSAFSSATLSKTRLPMKQHLLEVASSKSRVPQAKLRFSFVSALGIFLLLALFSLAIPPVRAFAQEIVQNIGNFFFVDQPTDAENYVATMQSGTPTTTPDPTIVAKITPQFFETKILSVADASAKAGYAVYTIGEMPDRYTLSTRDVLFTGQTITTDTSYRMVLDPPLNDGLQFAAIIALAQTLTNEATNPWITGTGDIPVIEVSVRGVKGAWIEQIPIYPFQNEEGEWDYARWNQLIWSENGFTFVLQTNLPTNMLSPDELIKIAESIKP
ncbi:MAG: hypothetical protein Q8R87_11710 [Anaerolineaceae bacterium]|nr:hypothetical protein [Anaerolineaceae bacterium]